MKNGATYFIAISIALLISSASTTLATEHGDPDGSCDLLCEAEVECEGHNQVWDGFPVIFDLVVSESENTYVRLFCVYKDGLVIVNNSN